MDKRSKRIFEEYYSKYKDTVYRYFCIAADKDKAKVLFEETWFDVWKWMRDTGRMEDVDVKSYLFYRCKIRAEEYEKLTGKR